MSRSAGGICAKPQVGDRAASQASVSNRPKPVGRYRRARGFFIAIDGGFPVEARRLPMLAAEMESQSNSIQFQNR